MAVWQSQLRCSLPGTGVVELLRPSITSRPALVFTRSSRRQRHRVSFATTAALRESSQPPLPSPSSPPSPPSSSKASADASPSSTLSKISSTSNYFSEDGEQPHYDITKHKSMPKNFGTNQYMQIDEE